MINNISSDLKPLVVGIDTLVHLENNPRKGNIDAIASSYKEFGQVRPLVVRSNSDGTSTVIAGNHQLEAAKLLGWTEIAVVQMDADNDKAIAFALADNRTMELGHTDPTMLSDMLMDIADIYPELFDGLGWDEFEMAAIEETSYAAEASSGQSSTYSTPVIIPLTQNYDVKMIVEEDDDGERRIVADPNVDHREVATKGAHVSAPGSAPQAVVQYTIVFDNPQQQTRWYEFVRWLRNDPAIAGNTTAEKLIDFLDQHIEI